MREESSESVSTFLPRPPELLCWVLHTRMAVIRGRGRFSFWRSESGMRQSTPRVSGFRPGGRGVGTPGLMGSLWAERATEGGGAPGVDWGREGGR